MRVAILTLCIGLFISCQRNKLPKTGFEGKVMPTFDMLCIDSTTYLNSYNIPKGKPSVILLFSPYCPYCRAETESILKNIKSLQGVNFYFVTSSPFDEMKAFYKNFELNKYKNITVGVDTGFHLIRYFNITGVPFTAIYNDKKILKQTFGGAIEAKAIEDILN